jgi:hypothetical protein
MNSDDTGLPVSLGFDYQGTAYAWVQLTEHAKTLTNLHEYILAPEYRKNDDGTFTVTGYGLIHRSRVPTEEQLDKKYGKGNY